MGKNDRLVVDDSRNNLARVREVTAQYLQGLKVVGETTIEGALRRLEKDTFRDVVTDGHLELGDCTPIVEAAIHKTPPIPVIIWSADDKFRTLARRYKENGHDVKFVSKGNFRGLVKWS